MFIEPIVSHQNYRGWIEVITGPMFSGKTEELLRRLKRATIANRKVIIFKPSVDKRYSETEVVSHDKNALKSIVISRAIEIIDFLDDSEVIGIDEAQFFNEAIIEIAQYLAFRGKRVIIAGLDMDSDGRPFGPMPKIMATAEYVTKLQAICVECGSLATHSFRIAEEKEHILLGSQDKYKPLCRFCFHKFYHQENFNLETNS